MLQITNLTKRKLPKLPYQNIATRVLGKKYDSSVVFAGNNLMKKLNRTYRDKDKAASVLSFPLSRKEGEIFINLAQKKYSPLYLFIHALLHLKGFEHNARMKREEKKLMKKYNHGTEHRYRAGCRNIGR